MSIGAVAQNTAGGVTGYKSLNYGQGYGNYQNQNNAVNKAAQNTGQFSMNQSANVAVDKNVDMSTPAEQASAANKNSKVDNDGCQTCKNRTYSDVSDDAGVSFQTPTKVDPKNAAAAVSGHEQEHVVRNQAKAAREDKKIVSQSVMLHTAICPECGKSYVSGGTTRTVTRGDGHEAAEKSKGESFYASATAEKMGANDKGVGIALDAMA